MGKIKVLLLIILFTSCEKAEIELPMNICPEFPVWRTSVEIPRFIIIGSPNGWIWDTTRDSIAFSYNEYGGRVEHKVTELFKYEAVCPHTPIRQL